MPSTQDNLPFAGKTTLSRHASWTGALHAAEKHGEKTLAYLALLASHGPLTDHQAASLLSVAVSSINSIRNGCGDRIQAVGLVTQEWGTGRPTRRTRWGLRRGVE